MDSSEPHVSSDRIVLTFLSLGPGLPIRPFPAPYYGQVLATALHILWLSHWSFVFNRKHLLLPLLLFLFSTRKYCWFSKNAWP